MKQKGGWMRPLNVILEGAEGWRKLESDGPDDGHDRRGLGHS